MAGADGSSGGPIRPPVALAFALVGFIALLVFGLGVASLAMDEDIVVVPGVGQLPGMAAPILAAGGFAGSLWLVIRGPRPSYAGALAVAAVAFLAYLAGAFLGAFLAAADLGAAFSVVARLATSWFGAVVALSALVAGWAGIALVRTRTRRPRWPWEHDDRE